MSGTLDGMGAKVEQLSIDMYKQSINFDALTPEEQAEREAWIKSVIDEQRPMIRFIWALSGIQFDPTEEAK